MTVTTRGAGAGVLLVSSGQRYTAKLLRQTGQPLTTKNGAAQNVSSAEVEKPWLR